MEELTTEVLRMNENYSLTYASILQLANKIAHARNLAITSTLHEAILTPEKFFHSSQQSALMDDDYGRRKQIAYDLMRKTIINRRKSTGEMPTSLEMIEADPTRITFSMEINSKDYGHLLKSVDDVENVAMIMADTNTHIQLADREELSGKREFMHQVTITGIYSDVEKARHRLRLICPIFVLIGLQRSRINARSLASIIHTEHWNYPHVTLEVIHAENINDFSTKPFLKVSGRMKHLDLIIDACSKLSEVLFGTDIPSNVYSTELEVASCHLNTMVGNTKSADAAKQILIIANTTNTLLSFSSSSDESTKTVTFRASGGLQAVLKARRYLMGLLPANLMVNVRDPDLRRPLGDLMNDIAKKFLMLGDLQSADALACARLLEFYDGGSRVNVRLTPSRFEPSVLLAKEVFHHCITIRSQEFNLASIYYAYMRIMNVGINAPCPKDYDDLIELGIQDYQLQVKTQCRGEAPPPEVSFLDVDNRKQSRSMSASSAGGLPPTFQSNEMPPALGPLAVSSPAFFLPQFPPGSKPKQPFIGSQNGAAQTPMFYATPMVPVQSLLVYQPDGNVVLAQFPPNFMYPNVDAQQNFNAHSRNDENFREETGSRKTEGFGRKSPRSEDRAGFSGKRNGGDSNRVNLDWRSTSANGFHRKDGMRKMANFQRRNQNAGANSPTSDFPKESPFGGTHVLALKTRVENEDVERERLFTHESSQFLDETGSSTFAANVSGGGPSVSSHNSSADVDYRTRVNSISNDAKGPRASPVFQRASSREGQNYRGERRISKTFLEPRQEPKEKEEPKVQLNWRGKSDNQEEKSRASPDSVERNLSYADITASTNNSSVRIDVLDLIYYAAEEQKGRKNRTYAEILEGKHREWERDERTKKTASVKTSHETASAKKPSSTPMTLALRERNGSSDRIPAISYSIPSAATPDPGQSKTSPSNANIQYFSIDVHDKKIRCDHGVCGSSKNEKNGLIKDLAGGKSESFVALFGTRDT
ncbi:unnamed protein product [Caenorhabditis auriculariae]|uniref:Defective in germ line development protein 3-like KH5 domain-containing protein n=1 Tax=Caenorhabditis auriculariae TaxID=2777116 RepID=A0A8S1HNX2_9PELO|nr:unnamed protein product [Caenorhabditis auriculariae]